MWRRVAAGLVVGAATLGVSAVAFPVAVPWLAWGGWFAFSGVVAVMAANRAVPALMRLLPQEGDTHKVRTIKRLGGVAVISGMALGVGQPLYHYLMPGSGAQLLHRAAAAQGGDGQNQAMATAPAPQHQYIVRASALNIRQGPDTGARVVAKIGNGGCVTVTGDARGAFMAISATDAQARRIEGYAHRDYLVQRQADSACISRFVP